MPRPLIIKINVGKPHPEKRPVTLSNVQVLKETSKASSQTTNTADSKTLDKSDNFGAFDDVTQFGTRTVRSLINKYESSTKSNLLKYKSKSLVDLPATQNDFLREEYKNQNSLDKKVEENISIYDIKKNAEKLLKSYPYDMRTCSWQNQVLEFLCQILDTDYSVKSAPKTVLSGEKTDDLLTDKNLSLELHDQSGNVRNIKQIFESMNESMELHSKEESMGNENVNNTTEYRKLEHSLSVQQLKFFNGEELGNQNVVEDYIRNGVTVVPDEVDETHLLTPSVRINERKNNFKSENEKPKGDFQESKKDNIIQLASNATTVIDSCNIEQGPKEKNPNNSLNKIKELTSQLEKQEQEIKNLTRENSDEGSCINEKLIRIIIRLDEIETYGDKNVLLERKNAIKYVQDCLQKLKDKINLKP